MNSGCGACWPITKHNPKQSKWRKTKKRSRTESAPSSKFLWSSCRSSARLLLNIDLRGLDVAQPRLADHRAGEGQVRHAEKSPSCAVAARAALTRRKGK